MKKQEYIEMLFKDNETESVDQKEINEAIIDCADIALSQVPDNYEINGRIGLKEFWDAIKEEGRKTRGNCVSPLRAAELIAELLGTKFERASKRRSVSTVKSLEDFL